MNWKLRTGTLNFANKRVKNFWHSIRYWSCFLPLLLIASLSSRDMTFFGVCNLFPQPIAPLLSLFYLSPSNPLKKAKMKCWKERIDNTEMLLRKKYKITKTEKLSVTKETSSSYGDHRIIMFGACYCHLTIDMWVV